MNTEPRQDDLLEQISNNEQERPICYDQETKDAHCVTINDSTNRFLMILMIQPLMNICLHLNPFSLPISVGAL